MALSVSEILLVCLKLIALLKLQIQHLSFGIKRCHENLSSN
jgi:hypothetical protein